MVSLAKFNRRQKRNRDVEWSVIEKIIKARAPGRFLDVGCGTGYAMAQAQRLGFKVIGVDPEIGRYGVLDEAATSVRKFIVNGVAENLPFADESFDVVYSSNAIEHFAAPEKGVAEMARVMRADGLAALLVPTGAMALLRLLSLYPFYTHRSIAKFLVRQRTTHGFMQIFLGPPHGSEAQYAFQEIELFSIKRWRALIAKYFAISEILMPCLYPWPDYPPLFPLIKLRRFSSSVAFICTAKKVSQENGAHESFAHTRFA